MSLELEQLVESKTATQKSPRFRVVMLNDDYTPVDFVEAILENVFSMPTALAQKVTMDIHHEGLGVCGVFTHEIAEAKVCKVAAISDRCGHPLLCEIHPEPED